MVKFKQKLTFFSRYLYCLIHNIYMPNLLIDKYLLIPASPDTILYFLLNELFHHLKLLNTLDYSIDSKMESFQKASVTNVRKSR